MAVSIGINGFGRIGRMVCRAALSYKEIQIVHINDPSLNSMQMQHLLTHDTVHGALNVPSSYNQQSFKIDGNTISVSQQNRPEDIPWEQRSVDIVIDATGHFLTSDSASAHLHQGVKSVVLTAPASDSTAIFVFGVNHQEYSNQMSVISNASCTTNCIAPLAKVIHDNFGIEEGLITTVHAITSTQSPTDTASRHLRSGRAAFHNIIPATTGAAASVGKVLPELSDRLSATCLRVPILDVSLIDFTCRLRQAASLKDIEQVIERASVGPLSGVLSLTRVPLVSSDIIGNSHSCIYDCTASLALNDRFVKLMAWYDNEWAYACRLLDMVNYMDNFGWHKD